MGKHTKKKVDVGSNAAMKKAERAEKKRIKKQAHKQRDYGSSEETQFARELLDEGYVIEYIDMDGNCLFRSICDQLFQDTSKHMEIRGKIMDYIEDQKSHFSLFIEDDESFEDYVSRMRTHGEWGGHQELYAASQILHVNIHVHQLGAARFLLPAPPLNSRQKDAHIKTPLPWDIHLSYHGEYHYNSLKATEGRSPTLIEHTAHIEPPTQVAAHHSAVFEHVALSVPWASESDILTALRLCDFEFDSTVEMLIANPASKTGSHNGCELTEACGEVWTSGNVDEEPPIESSLRPSGSRKTGAVKPHSISKGLSKKERRLLKKVGNRSTQPENAGTETPTEGTASIIVL